MAVILSARRTAVCPRGGAFARLRIEDLAAPVMQAVLVDAGIAAARVDEVILANALGAGAIRRGGQHSWPVCPSGWRG